MLLVDQPFTSKFELFTKTILMELAIVSLKTMGALFFILFFTSLYNGALAKYKVCIIGAGRAGLATIKIAFDKPRQIELIAFERNSDVGGLWIYRDDPELDENGLRTHSGIYKNLITLTTKSSMKYPDYEFISGGDDGRGHVSHATFLKYMRDYADHFKLRKHIKLNTIVTSVRPPNYKCTRGRTRWILESTNLKTQTNDSIICDAVIVCNGRYSEPNIPNIPGMNTFQGQKLHSRSYRKPKDFAGKEVIILGGGASGKGIARDLSSQAKIVYLSRRKLHGQGSYWKIPKNVIIVDVVVKAEENQFILGKDTSITVDAIIFCTGYVYSFPFLSQSTGIIYDKHRLPDLLKGFINKRYPSMALIGLKDDGGITELFYPEVEFFFDLQGEVPVKKCWGTL